MCSPNRVMWFVVVVFAVVASVTVIPRAACAQTPPAATAPPASPEIHAILEKIVHPKKVKVGDAVSARMTEPTKLKDGTELPKGDAHPRQGDRNKDEGRQRRAVKAGAFVR